MHDENCRNFRLSYLFMWTLPLTLECEVGIDHIQHWKVHEEWNPFHGRLHASNSLFWHAKTDECVQDLKIPLKSSSFACETYSNFFAFFSVICCPFSSFVIRWLTYGCNERIFDSPPFIYNKIFLKKTLVEVCSPHLYASFGTFCAQIGQLFEAQWIFQACLKIDKSL